MWRCCLIRNIIRGSFFIAGCIHHIRKARVQSARSTVIDEAIQQQMCCKTDPFCPTVMEECSAGSGREEDCLIVNRTNLMPAIVLKGRKKVQIKAHQDFSMMHFLLKWR